MAIYKDKIVVIDIEATCWQNHKIPDGEQNEIIEIGVCLLDADTLEISDQRSLFVKPEKSQVSAFCTELTGITQQQLDEQAMAFSAACSILERDYNTRNRLWSSWGSYDRHIFTRQCKERQVRYPFSRKHCNIKRVVKDTMKQRMPLAPMLELTGLGVVGRQHSGADDAYNTARLLAYLINVYGPGIMQKYGL